VLGAKTLRTLHAHLHDTVTAKVAGKPHRVTIVGVATFPSMGQSRFHSTSLGVGAASTTKLVPQNDAQAGGTYNWLLFKFTSREPSADITALRATVKEAGCTDAYCVVTDPRPQDISSYSEIRGVPAAVAGMLFGLVTAMVWLALRAATRRRRSDLLILRALGLRPRDIGQILRWQAVLLVVTAAVVGVPLGLAAGHITWSVFTFHLGIDVGPVTPVAPLVLGGVALLAVAVAVAALTARPLRRSASWAAAPVS
jgi:putative ABC transport system permease protein